MLIGIGSQYLASVPRPAPCAGSLYRLTSASCNCLGEADCSRFSALYVSFGTLGKSAWADAASKAPIPITNPLSQGFNNISSSPSFRSNCLFSISGIQPVPYTPGRLSTLPDTRYVECILLLAALLPINLWKTANPHIPGPA